MAGFAVFMGVVTFSFFGVVAASILSAALLFVSRRRLDTTASTRCQIGVAPFTGLAWVVIAFLIHVFVSQHFAHQDCGLGFSPDPFVTLPNGYTLGSANTYSGYIVAPGHVTDVPVTGPGYVRSIISLHLNGNIFSGTLYDFKGSVVRTFTLDAKTEKVTLQPSPNENDRSCDSTVPACIEAWGRANNEAQTGADSYWKLYRQYRHTWPAYVFLTLLVVGEIGVMLFVYRLWRKAASKVWHQDAAPAGTSNAPA